MRKHRDDMSWDVTGRIEALEQFTGALVARPVDEADAIGINAIIYAIPINDVPVTRVPVPRRSRIFLRSGEGHGAFADLTLTAPVPRPAMD
jgi:hypothetical protein